MLDIGYIPELLAASEKSGVPLYIAVALLVKETGGRNVYGNDRGGVFSTPGEPDIEVTEANYREFETRVLGGETSNGVGPLQITHPSFIQDAKDRGIRLWDPFENILYGLNLLNRYLAGRTTDEAIRYAGTRYNGAAAYGDDLLLRAREWQERLEDITLGTDLPISAVSALEKELRERGYDIYCGPSFVRAGYCAPGKHPHRTDSTHFATGGGAVDVGRDPANGAAISVFEKAHLDDLARELMRRGFRVLWGVTAHYDHLHADFNLYGPGGGHQVVFQGPNGEFTVAHILWVQQTLAKIKKKDGTPFYKGTFDGLRESYSLSAIKAFQSAHGLTADGEPGANTSAKLRSVLAAQAQTASAPKPTPTPAPAPVAPTPTLAERIKPLRIAGLNAYDTGVALAKFQPPAGEGVILVTRDSPDVMGATLIASRRTDITPLPMPRAGSLPGPIRTYLASEKPAWIRFAGGPAGIPDTTAFEALTAAGLKL